MKRPPLTDDEPCRATSVPIKMWLAFTGSIAIAPIERPVATPELPATSFQFLPKLVDLYKPTPASESPEPFGSPVPA